jgi:hypothetical protein
MSLALGKSARKCSMSVFCQKSASIPIVVAAIGDAMAAGIVHSLAKPEGNVTSLTFLNTELSAKRIELLKVALPMMQRISVFNDLNSQASYLKETLAAAKGLGIQMQHIDLLLLRTSRRRLIRLGVGRRRRSRYWLHRSSMRIAVGWCGSLRNTDYPRFTKAASMRKPAA